ncbi:Aspartyl/glutamyl-tRNA(Asn/Gln) amidotransferase subunit C [Weissella ceti]|uniref:Asp-tRNA(Asn)/Glu-tRNA(Gln) amidotransferase subunit GatC n=1 Tax=Weissella ceti TaxID=759620 RepID=UPI0004F80FE0|nr:Asp-tRNA(Asn)/Glu-tRNA(Gln) amidotransferase subunit GatC [Weissella ceti]AIM64471.1 Aspartyl/glutamyl-tRNA(Asn/Gln) amidotransferase subunit C [Weissella ceti]
MNEQSLSAEEVQNVAALSKLELTAEETDIMTDHLEKIFDVVFMLEGVDTTGVKPTYSPTDLQMTLRADEAVNAGQAEELLQMHLNVRVTTLRCQPFLKEGQVTNELLNN